MSISKKEAGGRAGKTPASQTTSKTSKVFIYGSLMEGMRNAHVLDEDAHGTRLGRAALSSGSMVDTGHGFPALIAETLCLARSGSPVVGELVEVDDAGLDALDVLEGVSTGLYLRMKAWVWPGGDVDCGLEPVHAYVYAMPAGRLPPRSVPVVSGDWAAHLKGEEAGRGDED